MCIDTICSIVRCENCWKGPKAHLFIRNLNEFNLEYLQALFSNILSLFLIIEKEARKLGYGPLLPCDFVSATRDQKELCSHFHRYEDGTLKRGILEHSDQCTARFEVYYPNEAALNPWIIMVCQHPHTHPDPRPTRTPQIIEDSFISLLETLRWRLADATSRRIILDAAFMTGLQNILGWQGVLDPLSDLHPSLGNHTARLINKLQSEHFPHGTGFKGILAMIEENRLLPPEQVYVRCAETYESPGERKFTIIICMFKAMIGKNLNLKRGLQNMHARSSSAVSSHHPKVLKRTEFCFNGSSKLWRQTRVSKFSFDIFMEVAGILLSEMNIVIQGLGLRLQDMCRDMPGYCSIDWTKPLHELTPYEHLKHCFRVCFQHYSTRVRGVQMHVSSSVSQAMMSLYSADPLPNFDGTLAIIRQGGKKAQDWLKDKLAAGSCMLAAVYRPASQIPVAIWKASPNTTNGNEQSHRNIYRDGRKLSLVPGALRGFQYDHRAMVTLKVLEEHGIHPRDRLPTYYLRASRAVVRTVAVQRRTVKAHYAALEKAYNQHAQLVDKAASQAKSLKRTQAFGEVTETALKRLRGTEQQLQGLKASIPGLQNLSSGRVPIPPSLNTPAGSNQQRSSAQRHIYSTFPNVASGSQPYIHSDHAADGTIPSSMQYTFKVDLPQGPTVAKHPDPAHPANQTALPGLHMLPTQQQTVNPNMLPLLQSPVDRPFPPAAYGHPVQMHYGSQS
ncbi:hypothetical protein M422DRAFT_272789 [Sphaerobolus stellatus SS14]|uniref:Uncharacterized protein n=1 Tax=Sphaerobolus stellatus (strain SS14) TaxID=990650 RepID=A0A0C9TAM3_SPHS4|nr:hypothetical protein M422DRAFT_272789 [Sphaerobolus stellatus SS14]